MELLEIPVVPYVEKKTTNMPNNNYIAGRRFEYECMAYWRELGYKTIRAAGSHGEADIVAYRPDRKPELVQCKLTKTESTGRALLKQFKLATTPSNYYHQTITIKIKGGEILQGTI